MTIIYKVDLHSSSDFIECNEMCGPHLRELKNLRCYSSTAAVKVQQNDVSVSHNTIVTPKKKKTKTDCRVKRLVCVCSILPV